MCPKVIKCKHCGRKPEEIMEYVYLAEDEGYATAEEAVIREEGTYNPATGNFYCTKCYIDIGQPRGKA